MEKKLTKTNDKRLCGVCGGIAEYLDIDSTVVRLLTATCAFFTGLFFCNYYLSNRSSSYPIKRSLTLLSKK